MTHDGWVFPAILAKRTTVWLLLCAAVTIVAAGPVPEAAAVTAPCADVLVIGARGSGQSGAGTTADGGSGMGPQVYGAYQRLVEDLPGSRVSGLSVKYPARGIETIALDPAVYFDGLEAGVARVRATLREQAARCPRQRYVLVGYSQGAMVMHRAVQDLTRSRSARSRDIRGRVDGVILLADGDRLAGEGAVALGTASGGRGVSYSDPAVSGVRSTAWPQEWRSRVISVCNQADVICDYRSPLQQDASGVSGVGVHINSYTGSPAVLMAADLVAARLRTGR